MCVCVQHQLPQTKTNRQGDALPAVPQVEKVEQVVAIDDSTQKLSAELLERVDAVIVGQSNQRKDVAIVDKAAVTLSGREKKATGEREGVRKCAQTPCMPSSSPRGLGWRQEGDRAVPVYMYCNMYLKHSYPSGSTSTTNSSSVLSFQADVVSSMALV